MSLFEKDMAQEAILGRFLSAQYSKLGWKFERINDKATQLKGTDLIIVSQDGSTHYKVDEKAQLHYLNKDLPTFALEIDYLKDGIIKEGWLFNKEKETELYAFVFSIHLIDAQTILQNEDQIKSCEVVFVNRKQLLQKLASLELDMQSCKNISKTLRYINNGAKIKHSSGFNFQLSNQLAEKPVNLVVRKSFLESFGRKYVFGVLPQRH